MLRIKLIKRNKKKERSRQILYRGQWAEGRLDGGRLREGDDAFQKSVREESTESGQPSCQDVYDIVALPPSCPIPASGSDNIWLGKARIVMLKHEKRDV